jgi:hypothetical protein
MPKPWLSNPSYFAEQGITPSTHPVVSDEFIKEIMDTKPVFDPADVPKHIIEALKVPDKPEWAQPFEAAPAAAATNRSEGMPKPSKADDGYYNRANGMAGVKPMAPPEIPNSVGTTPPVPDSPLPSADSGEWYIRNDGFKPYVEPVGSGKAVTFTVNDPAANGPSYKGLNESNQLGGQGGFNTLANPDPNTVAIVDSKVDLNPVGLERTFDVSTPRNDSMAMRA